MRFYTTTQLGNVQSMTPEGFLLCEDVPIGRTGEMHYGPGEVPVDPGPNGFIVIARDADEVFRPETIASFEGKPIVNEHPNEGNGDVTPANWRRLSVGHMQNVRRGAGVDDDQLLADFIVMDQDAIAAVRDGKREVSLGYDANYEQLAPGKGRQHSIIGNHVALVEHGRCGPRCAIGDEATMAKIKLRDRLRRTVKDEEKIDDILKMTGKTGDELVEQGNLDLPEGDGDDNGKGTEHHVHIHMASGNGSVPDAGTKPGETQDAEEGTEMNGGGDDMSGSEGGDAPAWFTKWASDCDARMGALEQTVAKMSGGGKTEDTDEIAGEDEKQDDAEDGKTKDSAGLVDEFKQVVSLAEILVPGFKVPTFDAKAPRKTTADAICQTRRAVLEQGLKTEDGKAAIEPVLGGRDLTKLTCDAAASVFNAAAALARTRNNDRGRIGSHLTGDGMANGHATPQTINDKNRAFWAAR